MGPSAQRADRRCRSPRRRTEAQARGESPHVHKARRRTVPVRSRCGCTCTARAGQCRSEGRASRPPRSRRRAGRTTAPVRARLRSSAGRTDHRRGRSSTRAPCAPLPAHVPPGPRGGRRRRPCSCGCERCRAGSARRGGVQLRSSACRRARCTERPIDGTRWISAPEARNAPSRLPSLSCPVRRPREGRRDLCPCGCTARAPWPARPRAPAW